MKELRFSSPYFWLLIIIFLGLLVRLYKIDSPIADWHSWRQADTAAVTRNFVKMGFTPFTPRYDDMSGIAEKPVANPARFRFVEFPIYNIAVYPFYRLFGVYDYYSRLVSVLFSLGSIALIFFIVRKYAGTFTGLISSFTFAILPFNVFFGRTTLPEPTFIFFALGMIYFMDKWIEPACNALPAGNAVSFAGRHSNAGRGIQGFLGLVFTAIAFLMKPWAIFFYLPLLYSVFVKQNTRKFWIKFIMLTIAALVPFILWRLWILQQPEGIPASNWLMNGDGIRFRPAFWWWIISERIGGEILGVTGLVLFALGLIIRPKTKNYFLNIWALSSFLFMIVVATGNVRHNYYQTQFIPVASIFLSIGFVELLRGNKLFIPRFWTIIMAIFLYIFSMYFGFRVVKEFYKVNNPDMVEAGKTADKILPVDAIVVAPYNGDTAFLYQTNRPGWPVTALPLPELVSDYGVTSFVSTSRDDKTNWVLRHFVILVDNPKFVIADLTKITKPLAGDPEP